MFTHISYSLLSSSCVQGQAAEGDDTDRSLRGSVWLTADLSFSSLSLLFEAGCSLALYMLVTVEAATHQPQRCLLNHFSTFIFLPESSQFANTNTEMMKYWRVAGRCQSVEDQQHSPTQRHSLYFVYRRCINQCLHECQSAATTTPDDKLFWLFWALIPKQTFQYNILNIQHVF